MGMNKNTILGWATFIMILMGLLLIAWVLFATETYLDGDLQRLELGFLANAWVFSSLKGRV